MRIGSIIALGLLLAACHMSAAPDLPPPPPHPNGQALWTIVHGKCLPDETANGRPAPCLAVDLAGGPERGFVVLKDLHGAEQVLVMPTIDVAGIEDPRLLAPGAPDRFAQAWSAKPFVDHLIGRKTPRDWMAVSVNSPYGRSQDLLHLHVDCLSPQAHAAIAAAAPGLGEAWSKRPLTLHGHPYFARRVDGETPAADPFRLLADGLHARREMGAWTLVLAGADFGGKPGFVLLAGRVDLLHGDFASGEELQDHACALAHAAALG